MTGTAPIEQDTATLVERFVQLSEQGADCEFTQQGQDFWKQLQAIADTLIRRGDPQTLITLAEDPRTPVKFYAAELCAKIAPDITRKVLTEIAAKGTNPWFQRRARMTLTILFNDYRDVHSRLSPETLAAADHFAQAIEHLGPGRNGIVRE